MSIVTVQLGQCGNQIGCQFFHSIIDDINSNINLKQQAPGRLCDYETYKETSMERFFHVSSQPEKLPEARAVLVDMESKVIGQMSANAQKSGSWRYASNQQVTRKQGSGNNWAHGYCTHGPQTKDMVMEMVRKQVERCDHFGGFMTLLSLAGGTGSGLGAYVNTTLRDEYPHSFIMNQVVWPYHMGEVIVQNYNALLTLSHLNQSSDAILFVQNDNIHQICQKLLNINHVSFTDMNNVIAQQLCSILQPAYEGINTKSKYLSSHLGDILSQVVAHPQYKLLNVQAIPHTAHRAKDYSTYSWTGLLKSLRQMLIANSHMEEGINWQIKESDPDMNKSLCNLLILRGLELSSQSTDVSQFLRPSIYSPIIPEPYKCALWSSNRPVNGYEKSATILSNSQSVVAPLNGVVDRAWQMFAARAYIHQYLKHGITEEDFVDSFVTLEQTIDNYKHL